MTVCRDETRCYFHYEICATRSYRQQLREWRVELRQSWKQLKQENMDVILANLSSLYAESEMVDDDSFTVRWTLTDVELYGVWIGDLEVVLELDQFKVKVWNLSIDADEKGGYQHPHVNSNGEICWNDHDTVAEAYHRAGEFLALKDLIDNLLQTYNSASPYINLDDWENGYGRACSSCEERFPEEDVSWSEVNQGELCETCRAWCERCEDHVYSNDYNTEFEACENCVENNAEPCHLCEERHWTEDLVEVEVKWFSKRQVMYFCAACKKDYEAIETAERKERHNAKSEETQDQHVACEDHADALRVLAPALDVPANPQ